MKIKLIRFISVLFFGLLFVLPAVAIEAKSRHSEFSEGDRDPPFICRQIKDSNLSKKRNGLSTTNLPSPAREYEDATGEQNIVVAFVAFADQTTNEDTSELEEKAREALFDGEESANKYFQNVSQGKMSLKGKILSGWRILKNSEEYWSGQDSSNFDYTKVLNDTISAIDPDVYLPEYGRIIIFLKDGEKRSYASGSIGKWDNIESDDGSLSIGICWMWEDDIDYPNDLRHELLHTFGGIHSGGIYLKDDSACERLCSNQEITKSDDVTWPPPECSTEEYGDGMCVLGNGRGHPSAFIKYKLGWLNDDQVLFVTESTKVTLIPRASSLAGIKMIIIKAKDADGTTKTYFLEYYKRLTGFDSTNKNGTKVLLRFFNEEEELNDSGTILLLKKNETETEDSSPPYVTLNLKEESFCDTENGIEINFITESAGEEMAEENSYVELQINLSCLEEKAPNVSVFPDYIQTMAGENVMAEISVANEMSALGCGTRTVNLEASLPDANWSAVFSPSSTFELGPGETGTITASILIPETATAGSYGATFKATDQDSGLSGEASVTIEVLPPPPTPTPTPVQEKEMILEVSINEVKVADNDIVVVSKGDWVRVAASVFDWYDENIMEDLQADKITCQVKRQNGKVKYSEEKRNSNEGNFAFKPKKKGWFEVEVIAYKTGYETASFQASFKVE